MSFTILATHLNMNNMTKLLIVKKFMQHSSRKPDIDILIQRCEAYQAPIEADNQLEEALPLITKENIQHLFADYLSNLMSDTSPHNKQNKILKILNSPYFLKLPHENKFKLLNDFKSGEFPPIYYLGIHKADILLWYVFKNSLIDFENGIAIETLFARKTPSNSNLMPFEDISENHLSEISNANDSKGKGKVIEEQSTILDEELQTTVEKKILAEQLDQHLLITLGFYLEDTVLSYEDFSQDYDLYNKTSLYKKTLHSLVVDFDKYALQETGMKNLYSLVSSLSISDQHTLFLAKLLEDTLKFALDGNEEERINNPLPYILAHAKKHLDNTSTELYQQLYNDLIINVREKLDVKCPTTDEKLAEFLSKPYILDNTYDPLHIVWLILLNVKVQCILVGNKSLTTYSIESKNCALTYFLLMFDPEILNTHFDKILAIGSLTILKLFIDKSKDINMPDPFGCTFLILSVESENLEATKILLDVKGIDINLTSQVIIPIKNPTFFYHTALSTATGKNNLPIVELLLEKSPDVNAQLISLALALQNNSKKIIKAIVTSLINPALVNKLGETPLHIATKLGLRTVASKLIHEGASLDSQDLSGKTPLHVAAGAGDINIVNLLIEHGVELDKLDNAGNTPLSHAIKSDNKVAISKLVNSGSDATLINSHGKTPLTLFLEKHSTIPFISSVYNNKENTYKNQFDRCFYSHLIQSKRLTYPELLSSTNLGTNKVNPIIKASAAALYLLICFIQDKHNDDPRGFNALSSLLVCASKYFLPRLNKLSVYLINKSLGLELQNYKYFTAWSNIVTISSYVLPCIIIGGLMSENISTSIFGEYYTSHERS